MKRTWLVGLGSRARYWRAEIRDLSVWKCAKSYILESFLVTLVRANLVDDKAEMPISTVKILRRQVSVGIWWESLQKRPAPHWPLRKLISSLQKRFGRVSLNSR